MFTPMSMLDNLLMPSFGALARAGRRNRGAERASFAKAAELVQLRPVEPTMAAESFSGGNQQKMVVARWIAGALHTRLLILDEPTQGVDIGARAEIYRAVQDFARTHDCAVLVSTADAEEVLALADRCLVVVGGQVTASLEQSQFSTDVLAKLAHGLSAGPEIEVAS